MAFLLGKEESKDTEHESGRKRSKRKETRVSYVSAVVRSAEETRRRITDRQRERERTISEFREGTTAPKHLTFDRILPLSFSRCFSFRTVSKHADKRGEERKRETDRAT